MRKIMLGAAVALAAIAVTGLPAGAGEPTCVEFFDEHFGSELANHGQHIVGDYVTGIGHDGDWPPAGQVGAAVRENGGALLPGQSGIMKHGAAPGASFCNGSNSPTSPPGHG